MAGLASIFGTAYEPTAAFSFEFIDRTQGTTIGKEIFFLLPPEEYSMTEGYRVTLTKTAGGGWIDDFGNDFKKIRLAGSLYSYYIGSPSTYYQKKPTLKQESSGLIDKKLSRRDSANIFQRVGGQALNQLTQAGKGLASSILYDVGLNIPGLSNMSGLEEFFRLRYVVSRFRDEYIDPNTKKAYGYVLGKKYADLQELEKLAKKRTRFYDTVIVVYHDYDDDNHYEVIFDNFQMSRSKSDPFTINYTIEMTALRLWRCWGYNAITKSVRKENPFQIVGEFKTAYAAVLESMRNIMALPNTIARTITSLYTGCLDMYNYFVDFTNGVSSDWNRFTQYIDELKKKNADFLNSTMTYAFGVPYDQFLQETKNIQDLTEPVNLSNIYIDTLATLDYNALLLSHMKGTEKYYSNEEKTKVFKTDEKVLSDTDFNTDAQSSDDNVFLTQGKSYYQVQQGDNLQTLAMKFYNDYEKASIISQTNDLTNRDFENEAMVGKSIVIPLLTKVSVPLMTENLVYFRRLAVATPVERKLQILGGDIKLDQNREIHADGSGDLLMIFGEDAYLANVMDRLSFETGTLAPVHPEWGVLVNSGGIPAEIMLSRIYENIEDQINQDPRTEIGSIDRDNATLTGDVLNLLVNLKPYEGAEVTFNAGDLLPSNIL